MGTFCEALWSIAPIMKNIDPKLNEQNNSISKFYKLKKVMFSYISHIIALLRPSLSTSHVFAKAPANEPAGIAAVIPPWRLPDGCPNCLQNGYNETCFSQRHRKFKHILEIVWIRKHPGHWRNIEAGDIVNKDS